MYCEARTSTGLGCDSLGIEQCPSCAMERVQHDWHVDAYYYANRDKAYTLGLFGPRYPVPAIPIEAWIDCYGEGKPLPTIIVQYVGNHTYVEVWPYDQRH